MSKRVRRIIFGDLSYIEEYEEYFSDMSKKGFHLEEMGKYFAYFKDENPKNLNYRIDMAKEDEKQKVIEKHKEKGWKFVTDMNTYLIFSSEEGSDLKELYPTPESQRLSLMEVQGEKTKKIFKNALTQAIHIIFILGIVYVEIKLGDGLYLSMSKGTSFYYLLLTLIPFYFIDNERRNLKRIEETLESGRFLSHQGDYFWLKTKIIIKNILFGLVLLIVIGILYCKSTQNESVELSKIDDLQSLPMVTVENIEDGNYEHERDREYRTEYHKDYGNILYKDWNILIPKDYELIETVSLYDEEENKESIAHLRVNYYLTRLDFIGEGLEKDILLKEKDEYNRELKKIKRENISVYGLEEQNTIYLLFRKDKEVTLLKYENGRASLEQIIEAVIEKIESDKI